MGNPVRIDYGTGHELSFIGFLASVGQLGSPPLSESTYSAVGLMVMDEYLGLVRALQRRYSLEPAGSHGVWGLDDYQFIPFLWGSAQLMDQSDIPPSSISSSSTLTLHGNEYHYLKAIDFILQIKKGRHFGEHSPMLNDISALPEWSRINRGLFKMYQEEVLNKFPVVQHFEFGTLLRWSS